ncbi:aminoglycoside phosphotransferase family protein [Sinomonas mesophila]|uniref:aminoglycoside phosphotransferase family protein n=1 Tax=Sinomonas mesophila TaxID=1531955 RepID=UPI00158A5729|nr:aminoglycoside phosphotransferase family protein [Sinomonas mesophila]
MPLPLTTRQRVLLDRWFGDWTVEEDMSWGVQGITVLRVGTPAGPAVVKASETSHHIQREARAHRQMTAPLLALTPPRTPRLLHADTGAGILACTWLPGRLVEGGPHERRPEVFRQAGELLARLHTPRGENRGYDPAVLNEIGDFLERARGLAPAGQLRVVAGLARAHRPEPRLLVATHGDYQPRNWIEDGGWEEGTGLLHVIDWGRAGYRPWVTDLVRLEQRWFAEPPTVGHGVGFRGRAHDGAALRAAFYAGYGRGPGEDPGGWRLDNLLQSLGTIVWAHDVGDAAFEEEGRRMLARVVEWWG